MNITIVMAGDEEGGLEKHVVDLSNELSERGHQVTLIAHEKYQPRVNPQVLFKAVDLSKSRRNPVVIWQLYQALKQSNPDIIHVHANKAASMVAPLLKWLKVPAVATLHNRKNKPKQFMAFDAVIAVSEYAAESLQHPHMNVIYNGIRKPVLQSRAVNHPPVYMAAARLVPAKAFDLLIQAWKGMDAKLWIVGEGPEKEKLEHLIAETGQSEQIQMLGYRSDILDLMQQVDAFVISSHYEGCPYTMVEALLTRTPIVSTSVGAMIHILPQQYMCPHDDVPALHQVLAKSLSDLPTLYADYQPVFAFAEQQLVLSGMTDKIEALYQQCLSRHGS